MDNSALGTRMKEYENVERRYLTRRAPVIVRIDGKAFHSYTRGFEKPFDESFLWAMRLTMQDLCRNMMGAKLGYTQSDEISILLTDDDTIETQAWFGKNLQKIVSISAAMATFYFNLRTYQAIVSPQGLPTEDSFIRASEGFENAWCTNRMAIFDARAFTIPREEVMNYFEWRQQDCTRNSIQSVAQANFSQKQLQGKSCNEIQNMLLTEKDINWNNYPTALKRGACARKGPNGWYIDTEIPIFHEQPDYVNSLVYHDTLRH